VLVPRSKGYRCRVFERFTDRARRVLVLAQEEAQLLDHTFLGTEHILLGLIGEEEGIAANALRRCGITLEAARAAVEQAVGAAGNAPVSARPFTPRAKKVLELALREALQLDHSYIGTEHLLFGLIREGNGVAISVIRTLGTEPQDLLREAFDLLSGSVQLLDEESGSPVRSAHDEPPHCPRCRAGLFKEARYSVLEVPTGDPDADDGVLAVTLIYCNRCGTTLGTA
jgi:ATP-dependent Clp protease ATP-binding subunit ClpC